MKTNQWMAAVASAVSLGALSISATAAPMTSQSLDVTSAPVSDVVSQFHRIFGGNIVIKPGLSVNRAVSFTVNNIKEPGAAVETVQDLANALGADWQKTFVISRASDDSTAKPLIDTNAPANLKSATMSAEDAINLVANLDGATAQFYSPVSGTVHFSSTDLTAPEAAKEVADQTHTVWKAYYALVPRGRGGVPLGAKVIGRTASGRPILEMPTVTFRTPPPDKTPAPETQTAANAPVATPPNAAPAMNPYYGNPSQYGYSPYFGNGFSAYPYNYVPGFGATGLTVFPQTPYYGGPPIVFGSH